MTRAALALTLLAGLAAPATASAEPLALRADARERGYVGLVLGATPGLPATIRDETTGSERTLTPARAEVRLARFARWRCEARLRRFTVTQAGQTAGAETRTPSCARRLELAGPRAVRAGGSGALRVRDRWGLGGLSARLCVRPPGAGERCRRVLIGAGRGFAPLRVRHPRPGVYLASLRTRYSAARHTIRARPRGGRLRVLATGDSMIQIVDSYLERGMGRRSRVRSDARISTGISKPSLLDWAAHARRQAAARPDAVVMFIGANDGFNMRGRRCCGPGWVAEYARRARRMMRTYAQGGRAKVYWLLLPAPRDGFFREVFPAVNAALRRAARGLEDDVELIDLAAVFTPGGRFRGRMEVDGRERKVRNGDGVHLSPLGASIAARLVIRALRRDRMLP